MTLTCTIIALFISSVWPAYVESKTVTNGLGAVDYVNAATNALGLGIVSLETKTNNWNTAFSWGDWRPRTGSLGGQTNSGRAAYSGSRQGLPSVSGARRGTLRTIKHPPKAEFAWTVAAWIGPSTGVPVACAVLPSCPGIFVNDSYVATLFDNTKLMLLVSDDGHILWEFLFNDYTFADLTGDPQGAALLLHFAGDHDPTPMGGYARGSRILLPVILSDEFILKLDQPGAFIVNAYATNGVCTAKFIVPEIGYVVSILKQAYYASRGEVDK